MKMNRFTKKALRDEFPFLGDLLDGVPDYMQCYGCKKSITTSEWDALSLKKCSCGSSFEHIYGVRGLNPEEVIIKRIDDNLLNAIPTYYNWDGSCVGIVKGTEFVFVLKDGTVIRSAVEQDYTSGSNYAHSGTHTRDGETVIHAIDRHGIQNSLSYIIANEFGIRTIEHYSEGSRLIIYKPGKGVDLEALIQAAYEAAAEQVKVEADL